MKPADVAAFGRSDESLTVLLGLLVLSIFVVQPLTPWVGSFVGDLVFALLLLSGAATVRRSRAALVVSLALVAVAIVLSWPGLADANRTARIVQTAVEAASLLLFTSIVCWRALAPGPVTRYRLQGAVAAYLLIGLTCALGYELFELAQPGSIRGLEPGGVDDIRRQVGYFSFVTLTTVGYGDLSAASQGARSLAVFEALIGQLYPAIVLGSMISALPAKR